MRRFKLIEHTADIGLVAYGQTLAEAYANAAYGMFSIIAELDNVREVKSYEVELNKRLAPVRDTNCDAEKEFRKEIEKTDKEIDDLVYDLCELTEEERKIAEEVS